MKRLSERKKKWIERTVANDRSYKLFLYNRFFIFLVLVLIQVVLLIGLTYLIVYNSTIGILLQLVIGILELVMVLYLVNKTDRPSSKLNWILFIVALPAVGVPTYLLYGEGRPTRKMHKKIQRSKTENAKYMQKSGGTDALPLSKPISPLCVTQEQSLNDRAEGLSRYLEKYAGYPVFYDGDVTYYKSGEEMYPELLQALESAEKFILVEYFIIAGGKMWGNILKVLLRKAMEGVQVRIIYDDFGCMMTLPPRYDRYLSSLHPNMKCLSFNKVVPLFALRMNNRDHRKILVVDGKTGFTGGINLADEYINEKRRFGYWKDTGVKITGGAVDSFTKMFFYMWNAFHGEKEDLSNYLFCGDGRAETPSPSAGESEDKTPQKNTAFRLQPYDDSPLDKISVGETVYADIIHRASKYVWIFTPYLLLDDYMRSALAMAAMRGVDVRIVTPGIPDKKTTYRLTRANYAVLMKSGVKIYEYTPGFIHAKSMLCDDEYAVVGTINLDYRSLYLHFENAVYFAGCDAVADMKRDYEEVFSVSKECTQKDPKRSLLGRLIDSVLRLFETMM